MNVSEALYPRSYWPSRLLLYVFLFLPTTSYGPREGGVISFQNQPQRAQRNLKTLRFKN